MCQNKRAFPLPWKATADGLLHAANGLPIAVFGAPEASPSRKDVKTATHVAIAVTAFHPLVDALRGLLDKGLTMDTYAAARAALEMAGYPADERPPVA